MTFLDKVFSGKPSRPDFTEMMIQAFQKAGIETADQSESDFSLKLASGGTVFLGNVYAMFAARLAASVNPSSQSSLPQRLPSLIFRRSPLTSPR